MMKRTWKSESAREHVAGCGGWSQPAFIFFSHHPIIPSSHHPVTGAFVILLTILLTCHSAADIAEAVPADSLLYAEVGKPAELWSALQNTELRQAIRSSLVTEFILNFTASTADLFSQSLVNRPLSEAVGRYGLSFGVAFRPGRPGSMPPYAVILEASENAAELRELLLKNIENTLTARFPNVRVSRERIAGSDVRTFAFSPKRVWCLAVCKERVIFGGRPAVTWMLKGGDSLASKPGFRAIRADAIALSRKTFPAGPAIFCYSEISEAAGRGSFLYAQGTQIAGALNVDGALIRDVSLLRGPLTIPELGDPKPCTIASAFPRGPFIIHQVSFASDGGLLRFLPMEAADAVRREGRDADDGLAGVFTGTGFVAISVDGRGPVVAAEVADPSRLDAFLKRLGLTRNGERWASPSTTAMTNGHYVYLGAAADVNAIIRALRAPNPGGLDGRQDLALMLKLLPKLGQGYSLMTPDFLKRIPWAAEFEFIRPAAAGLSPACAQAEKTGDGLVITSVSPCGYGIWLVSANVDAARNNE